MRLVTATVAAVVAAVSLTASAPARVPNDPGWRDAWASRFIRLQDVWDITTGDPSIVIAAIDTGASELPDLRGALVPGWDFVENDMVPQDTHGHGTWIAGVLAARGDNGIGIAGYCWACRVMPIRVAAGGEASPERIAAGIVWAVDHGARIVNVSYSRRGAPNAAEQAAVKYAVDRGVLVVAGAGNDGSETPTYPASYPGALAVAASNDFDQLYFWSTRGPWVQLSAPGCQVVLDPAVGPGTICGTSFTPAVVSGIAALILSANPSLTANQVRDVLLETAKPIAGVTAGRVDPMAALNRLGLVPPPPAPPPPPPPAPPTTPKPGTKTGGAKSNATSKVRYERKVRLRSGRFRRSLSIPVQIGRSRLEVQVQILRAEQCALSVSKSNGDLYIALPGTADLLSLAAIVPAGRYRVEVDCWPARQRAYTLAVSASFPVR